MQWNKFDEARGQLNVMQDLSLVPKGKANLNMNINVMIIISEKSF